MVIAPLIPGQIRMTDVFHRHAHDQPYPRTATPETGRGGVWPSPLVLETRDRRFKSCRPDHPSLLLTPFSARLWVGGNDGGVASDCKFDPYVVNIGSSNLSLRTNTPLTLLIYRFKSCNEHHMISSGRISHWARSSMAEFSPYKRVMLGSNPAAPTTYTTSA